ncbi:hypothetical protein FQU76_29740 [Streptomyces qinzhouensis]|uniref:Uncharacterized protein n=1 Tax=Streptomyces qinzhouensis TaxID=2599401 RepID=A0A5B8JQP0_9ACTN|nr:hypothetical protein FQU76_29740 [Streptomyces qinzhouensis]
MSLLHHDARHEAFDFTSHFREDLYTCLTRQSLGQGGLGRESLDRTRDAEPRPVPGVAHPGHGQEPVTRGVLRPRRIHLAQECAYGSRGNAVVLLDRRAKRIDGFGARQRVQRGRADRLPHRLPQPIRPQRAGTERLGRHNHRHAPCRVTEHVDQGIDALRDTPTLIICSFGWRRSSESSHTRCTSSPETRPCPSQSGSSRTPPPRAGGGFAGHGSVDVAEHCEHAGDAMPQAVVRTPFGRPRHHRQHRLRAVRRRSGTSRRRRGPPPTPAGF